jgi:hypothetical protein
MAAFMLMAGSFPAQARLGEDLKALEERFGSPIEDKQVSELDLRQLSFRNHDLMVGVTLIDNRSASEQYVRSTFKRDSEGKLILIAHTKGAGGSHPRGQSERKHLVENQPSPGPPKKSTSGVTKKRLPYYKIQQDHIVEVRLSTSEFNRHLTRIAKEKK